MQLLEKKCRPCEGIEEPLKDSEVEKLLKQISGWSLENKRLRKSFKFKDFVEAMKFVNKVADLAENEGHHPDIVIHYNRVSFELWTHVIHGLSENDFILAAKIDKVNSR